MILAWTCSLLSVQSCVTIFILWLWGVTEDNASSHDRVKSTFLSHYQLTYPVAFIITLISTEAWLSFSRNCDSVFILLWRKAILLGTAKEENESQEKRTSQSFGNERSINCQLTDIGKRYFPNITVDLPLECTRLHKDIQKHWTSTQSNASRTTRIFRLISVSYSIDTL